MPDARLSRIFSLKGGLRCRPGAPSRRPWVGARREEVAEAKFGRGWRASIIITSMKQGGQHYQRTADASSTKTQSRSPELLFPGGVNFLLPVLTNGEPSMSTYLPFVGSYQRAVAVDSSFDMSTVIVRMVGT